MPVPTKVVNLRTQEERLYELPPRQALAQAYSQETGVEIEEAKLEEGHYFIYCGDWAVRKEW